MNTLKNLAKAFIVIGLLLAVIQIAVPPAAPLPAPPTSDVTYIGTVTDVSPLIWDGSGHDSITVDGDTPVLIIGTIGAPGHKPTVLKLKDRIIENLVGKRIKIVGVRIVKDGNALIARIVEELP